MTLKPGRPSLMSKCSRHVPAQVKTVLNSIASTWSGVGADIKSTAEPGLPVHNGKLQLGKPTKQKLWLRNCQGNGTIKLSPKWLTMREKCSLFFCDVMDRTVQGLRMLRSNVFVKSNICVFGEDPLSVRGERAQTLAKPLHRAQVVVCPDGLLFGQKATFFSKQEVPEWDLKITIQMFKATQ